MMAGDLLRDGYEVHKSVIPKDYADHLAAESDVLVKQQTEDYQTLVVPFVGALGRLLRWQPALDILKDHDPRYYSGVFINKRPHEPKRPWHQDWWYWSDPASTRDIPPQIGLMYYFRGSTKKNGCLRVIPGSHRKWHPIHDHYFDGNYTMADYPDEVAVEAEPTDLVLMDARLLHSTYENTTGENRLAVNLWHVLRVYDMLPGVRSFMHRATVNLPLPNLVEDPGVPPVQPNKDTYLPQRHQLT